jgi:hypothetical protein
MTALNDLYETFLSLRRPHNEDTAVNVLPCESHLWISRRHNAGIYCSRSAIKIRSEDAESTVLTLRPLAVRVGTN